MAFYRCGSGGGTAELSMSLVASDHIDLNKSATVAINENSYYLVTWSSSTLDNVTLTGITASFTTDVSYPVYNRGATARFVFGTASANTLTIYAGAEGYSKGVYYRIFLIGPAD